jgi:PEP-CTERM motif
VRLLNTAVLALLGTSLLSASGLIIVNPGFENPDISTGVFGGCTGSITGGTYIYDPAGCGQGWTFESSSGLTRNPSAFDNPVGPDGSAQSAFLQGISDFSQTITGITIGSVYTISFYATQRTCCDGSLAQTISVEFDGTILTFNGGLSTTVLPNTKGWTLYTTDPFVAQDSTAVLKFSGNYGNGDATAFVDVVTSAETVPEPGTWGLAASGIVGLIWSRRRRR